jgi:hypothetical protein
MRLREFASDPGIKEAKKKKKSSRSMGGYFFPGYGYYGSGNSGEGGGDGGGESVNRGMAEEWSQKYKSSINCSHPRGFSQKAHCAGKNKHNESIEMEMVCETCGMCETHGNLNEIKKGQKDSNGYTKCWSGYHAQGTKKSATTGKQVRNCVPNESVDQGVAEGADDIKKQMSKLEALALAANRAGDDAKCKMYQQKIQSLKQKLSQSMSESFIRDGADWDDALRELNVFNDVFLSPDIQDTHEYTRDPEWQELAKMIRNSAKVQEVYGQLKKFANLGVKLTSPEVKRLDSLVWDGGGDMDIDRLADLYAHQLGAVEALLKTRGQDKTKPGQTIHESNELNEEFDLIESIIDQIAEHNGVDSEVVWADLESLTEDELYAFAVTSQLNEDWQKANKKDRTAGMSQKAVNAYRRENPGSKLKTAVTTKPSKLKKGSKASKRRKSYCSRSRGQMKMHNISCAKTPDKAICKARRRWNC